MTFPKRDSYTSAKTENLPMVDVTKERSYVESNKIFKAVESMQKIVPTHQILIKMNYAGETVTPIILMENKATTCAASTVVWNGGSTFSIILRTPQSQTLPKVDPDNDLEDVSYTLNPVFTKAECDYQIDEDGYKHNVEVSKNVTFNNGFVVTTIDFYTWNQPFYEPQGGETILVNFYTNV